MSGKKGRSGRRTKYEEVHVNELAGMSVRWAIENWDKFDHADKMRVLLALAHKYVVEKREEETTVKLTVIESDIIERQELINQRFVCTN